MQARPLRHSCPSFDTHKIISEIQKNRISNLLECLLLNCLWEIDLICFLDNKHVQFIMQKMTEKDQIGFQWDHISPSVNTTNHMSSTKISRVFMDRPRASIVFASQQHCKSCISDPSQVKLSLAISTAAAVGFTHKCFVVSEWVHAAAWALTNTRLQVSSLVYPVLY